MNQNLEKYIRNFLIKLYFHEMKLDPKELIMYSYNLSVDGLNTTSDQSEQMTFKQHLQDPLRQQCKKIPL